MIPASAGSRWKSCGVTDFKRGYGWDRTPLDGRRGAATWCGHASFAYNLVKIALLGAAATAVG